MLNAAGGMRGGAGLRWGEVFVFQVSAITPPLNSNNFSAFQVSVITHPLNSKNKGRSDLKEVSTKATWAAGDFC